MNYTLKQLQERVNQLIENQGEDAHCAAWIYTAEDCMIRDEDDEPKFLPAKVDPELSERDTELATLRVLGAPMKKIGKMMFWEHLGIGLIGGILGAIFAFFGTVLLIQSQVQWAFYFTIEPQFAATFTIVGIITVISIALTPVGMWRISKMDLVDKVKDLSQ